MARVLSRFLSSSGTGVQAPTERFPAYGMEATFNKLQPGLTNVDAVRKDGFKVNGLIIAGPVFLLREVALEWKGFRRIGQFLTGLTRSGRTVPPRPCGLTIESFRLLTLLHPVPSLLIVGTGSRIIRLDADLVRALRKIAPIEVLGAQATRRR